MTVRANERRLAIASSRVRSPKAKVVGLAEVDVGGDAEARPLRARLAARALPPCLPVGLGGFGEGTRVPPADEVDAAMARPLRRGGVGRGVPKRRVRLLDGADRQFGVDAWDERAFVLEHARRQGLGQRPERLGVDRLRVRRVDTEVGELVGADTAADAEVEATVGHLVEGGDLFGEPERMVGGEHVDERAEPHRRRPLRERREKQARARADGQRRAVVLGHVIVGDALALGLLGEQQAAVDYLAGRRVAQVKGVEDAELEGIHGADCSPVARRCDVLRHVGQY